METTPRRITPSQAVEAIGRGRLSLVTRAQLDKVGVGDRTRATALSSGALVPVQRGVYRPPGVRLSIQQELLAACLAAGPDAVASHRAALWLWGLTDVEPPAEVTVFLTRGPAPRATVVHRSTDLMPAHRTLRRGVPVTTPARTLLDAGAVIPKPDVGLAVEHALVQRLVTVQGLRVILEQLGRRGRRGTAALRGYLDARALDDQRPESVLEPLMARLVKVGSIAPVLFQQRLVLDGKAYRPDFLLPLSKLTVEVDGLDAHSSRAALDADLARQNAFVRNGYMVLRYTATHLRRPAAVAHEVVDVALQRRDRTLPAVAPSGSLQS